jgi:uncharacterized protein
VPLSLFPDLFLIQFALSKQRQFLKPNYRRCISCRKVAPKEEFWRIIRIHPSHAVQLDEGMGRSAYICPQENCLQLAQKKGRLDRVLKAPVPEQIYTRLWQRYCSKSEQPTPDTNYEL